MRSALREQLVSIALQWEARFGNAPAITSALSEYDAALLVGLSEDEYSTAMIGSTAVQKGYDFAHKSKRYQVKANRPSGKRGSLVTLVPRATNYEWDFLVWILYDRGYVIQEAWLWDVEAYRVAFHGVCRLSPADLRAGRRLVCPS